MMKPSAIYIPVGLVMMIIWVVVGLGFLTLAALLSEFGFDVFDLVMAFPLWVKILLSCIVVLMVLSTFFVYMFAFAAVSMNATVNAMGHDNEDSISVPNGPNNAEFVEIHGVRYKRSENVE